MLLTVLVSGLSFTGYSRHTVCSCTLINYTLVIIQISIKRKKEKSHVPAFYHFSDQTFNQYFDPKARNTWEYTQHPGVNCYATHGATKDLYYKKIFAIKDYATAANLCKTMCVFVEPGHIVKANKSIFIIY